MHARTHGGLLGLLLLAACGPRTAPETRNTNNTSGNEQPPAAQPDAAVAAAEPDAAPAAPAPPPAPALVVGTSAPLEAGDDPHVSIRSPANNAVLRTNSVEVRLEVTGWPAPTGMRHIHLILDNDPYTRIDNPAEPHTFANLAPGMHVLRAFPGRGSHESVKRPGAFAMSVFYVGPRPRGATFDARAPLLTYSRPKGDYFGAQAEHILLDFFLTNIPNDRLAADGFRVRYAVDALLTGELTAWEPHYLDNLPNGEHHIVLDLLGANGQPVPGPFNHIDRVIRVDRNAQPAAPPAAAAADPHTGH